ncbi:MAG: hypothetical protein AB7I42_24860 [Bradyrhizobium sp.]|uniref:hypothetical protein n=1 Tax=Bradyrhizobium sp. TaxID=376 RepID=UPI003D12EAA5
MRGYTINNELGGTKQSMSTSYKSLLILVASNTALLKRGAVHEFTVGVDGTPADQAMTYDISRVTAVGTATAITPTKLDPADGASAMEAHANSTSEPTVTSASSLWATGINQRATHRWVAMPGQELIIPATDDNGLCLRAKSPGYTGTVIGSMHFQ